MDIDRRFDFDPLSLFSHPFSSLLCFHCLCPFLAPRLRHSFIFSVKGKREKRISSFLVTFLVFLGGEEKDRIDRGTVNITRSENDSVSGKENYESCVYDKSDDI